MSIIVGTREPRSFTIPFNANWWRLRLIPNGDGRVFITTWNHETDWNDPSAVVRCEFFDGDDTILDAGLDRPTCKVRFAYEHGRHFLDVLHDGVPTRTNQWVAVTVPGMHCHPDDEPWPPPPYQRWMFGECEPRSAE